MGNLIPDSLFPLTMTTIVIIADFDFDDHDDDVDDRESELIHGWVEKPWWAASWRGHLLTSRITFTPHQHGTDIVLHHHVTGGDGEPDGVGDGVGRRAREVPCVVGASLGDPQSDHRGYDRDQDHGEVHLDTVVLGGATQSEVESGPGKMEQLVQNTNGCSSTKTGTFCWPPCALHRFMIIIKMIIMIAFSTRGTFCMHSIWNVRGLLPLHWFSWRPGHTWYLSTDKMFWVIFAPHKNA